MKRSLLLFTALLAFIGLALIGCLHQIPITDPAGEVLGYLEPDTPVVVTERQAGSTEILLSGWVNATIRDDGLRQVENYEGLWYGDLSVGRKGTATQILGILDNRTDKCFDLLTLEVSFWESTADGGTVKGTTMTSLRRLQPGERVPLDVLAIGFSREEIADSTIRVRYAGSLSCSTSES